MCEQNGNARIRVDRLDYEEKSNFAKSILLVALLNIDFVVEG